MYVIGVNEWDFLNIKSRTMMMWESCKTWSEIEKITYECSLSNATIFQDYETANKTIEEIKHRKNEILFENYSIVEQIIDKEEGKEFDVDTLKIYELVPIECKDRD